MKPPTSTYMAQGKRKTMMISEFKIRKRNTKA